MRRLVCALASAGLLCFAVERAMGWSIAFYGLALFFNYPHYMATIYRAYHTSADFQKYRIFTVHITALIALTLILSHFWFARHPLDFHSLPHLEPVALQRPELRPVHDVRPARRRSAIRPPDDGPCTAAFLISYLILLLSFMTGPSNDPLVRLAGNSRADQLRCRPAAWRGIRWPVRPTAGLDWRNRWVGGDCCRP